MLISAWIDTFDEMCAEAVQGSRTIELAYTRLHMSSVSSRYDQCEYFLSSMDNRTASNVSIL